MKQIKKFGIAAVLIAALLMMGCNQPANSSSDGSSGGTDKPNSSGNSVESSVPCGNNGTDFKFSATIKSTDGTSTLTVETLDLKTLTGRFIVQNGNKKRTGSFQFIEEVADDKLKLIN